jgi:hypothetical protein
MNHFVELIVNSGVVFSDIAGGDSEFLYTADDLFVVFVLKLLFHSSPN